MTTLAVISFVIKMNRENIRTPARSIANLECSCLAGRRRSTSPRGVSQAVSDHEDSR